MSISPQSAPLSKPKLPEADPNARTLDGEGLLLDFREAPQLSQEEAPSKRRVEIIEASAGDTAESLKLLRTRLAAVSLALAVGFFIFAVWFTIGSLSSIMPMSLGWLSAQYMVTIVLFGTWVWLRKTPDLSAGCGRSIECLVFGTPALFFASLTAKFLFESIAQDGHVAPVSLNGWMLLIFAHSIFIPNPWKRAGLVSIGIALLPIATTLICVLAAPRVWQDVFHNPSWFVDMTLGLLATCTVAIIGVRTIWSMRAEVNEAKQMGRYRLRELIGAGGMGEVYLAEHQMLKRPCAIKMIRPERAGDPKTLARFEREVQATAKLSHWNSVYIYDYGNTSDGTLYYVMEYLPGLTLQELVAKVGPLPPGRAIYLLRQICGALQEAHGVGLLHRDVKPSNLFVSERGGRFDVAKLLDFGLVKPLQMISSEETELTQQGGLTGSPLYMSPEQALGEVTPDARSDIYSLGAVAYYMIVGKPPFAQGQGLRVILQHLHETPVRPSLVVDGKLRWTIPEDLETIIMTCLEKSPDNRFETIAELESALAKCESIEEWGPEEATQWWRSHCPKLRQHRPCET